MPDITVTIVDNPILVTSNLENTNIEVTDNPTLIAANVQNPINISVSESVAANNIDTSNLLTTGDAFSTYYPRDNPSGYITSLQAGSVVSLNGLSGILNLSGINNTIFNSGQYIFISGLSGTSASINTGDFIYTGNLIKFNVFLTSGAETEFINYPISFNSRPTSINCEFENDRDNFIYNTTISGIGLNGFFINYSDFLSNSGYKLNITINR